MSPCFTKASVHLLNLHMSTSCVCSCKQSCFVKEIMMHCNLDVYGHGCIQMTTPATSLIMTAEEFCHIKADPSLRFRPLWRLHFFQGYFLAQLCNHCWITCVMETEDPISNIYVSVYLDVLQLCVYKQCNVCEHQVWSCGWAGEGCRVEGYDLWGSSLVVEELEGGGNPAFARIKTFLLHKSLWSINVTCGLFYAQAP